MKKTWALPAIIAVAVVAVVIVIALGVKAWRDSQPITLPAKPAKNTRFEALKAQQGAATGGQQQGTPGGSQ